MCPSAKVNGVWPFNDAWLRTSLSEAWKSASVRSRSRACQNSHATWPQSWMQRENWEFETHRLPGCQRRARPAVVLEGIGAAFEQAGRVLAQRRVGIRPRPAEAQRVRQASGPREHARPLRTPPSGELIRRRMRREADRSRRAVRQQQRLDAPTRTIVCTSPPSSGRLADTGWLSSNARCTHAATVRPGAVAPWRATTLRGPHWADAIQVGRILPRELGIRDAQDGRW